MLFKKIIAVYSEKHMKAIKYAPWAKELPTVKADTHSYHYTLQG
jgi:hypothetical protein